MAEMGENGVDNTNAKATDTTDDAAKNTVAPPVVKDEERDTDEGDNTKTVSDKDEDATTVDSQTTDDKAATNAGDTEQKKPEEKDEIDEAQEARENKVSTEQIRVGESSFIAKKILLTKSHAIKDNEKPDAWNANVNQYAAIVAVEIGPEGKQKYNVAGEPELDYIPLDAGNKLYINTKGENPMASNADDDNAIRLVRIVSKNKENVTCVYVEPNDKDNKEHQITLPLSIVAEAQMHNAVEAGKSMGKFNKGEAAIVGAYDTFAQTIGRENEDHAADQINAVYENDEISVKDVGTENGCMKAEQTVDGCINALFPDIIPAAGQPLTETQVQTNQRRAEIREKIKANLQTSERTVVTPELLANILRATNKDIANAENIDKVVQKVMNDMDPVFAGKIAELMQNGDVKGIYEEFEKQLQGDPEKLVELKKRYDGYSKTLLSIGGGLAALLLMMAMNGLMSTKR